MLEANLIADHSLHMQLDRGTRHCEVQHDHAARWDWLRKKRTEPAFRDLVAVPFEVTLAEADCER